MADIEKLKKSELGKIVFEIVDERGGIVISETVAGYTVSIELDDFASSGWSAVDAFPTLAEAVADVADRLKTNVENEFYAEDV